MTFKLIIDECLMCFRMLWFACRGNVYLRHSEIDDTFEDPVSVRYQQSRVIHADY